MLARRRRWAPPRAPAWPFATAPARAAAASLSAGARRWHAEVPFRRHGARSPGAPAVSARRSPATSPASRRRRLVLLSRRGRGGRGAARALSSELSAEDREVDACDVADRERCTRRWPPSRAVIAVVHAAGVLDDARRRSARPEPARRRAAAEGRRRLAPATSCSPRPSFVLFSSAAAVARHRPARPATPRPTRSSTRSRSTAALAGLPAHVARLGAVGDAGGMAGTSARPTAPACAASGSCRSTPSAGWSCFDRARGAGLGGRSAPLAARTAGAARASPGRSAAGAPARLVPATRAGRRVAGGSLAATPRRPSPRRSVAGSCWRRSAPTSPPCSGTAPASDRPGTGVQGPRPRLARRGRAAQPALAGHRPAPAADARLRPPDGPARWPSTCSRPIGAPRSARGRPRPARGRCWRGSRSTGRRATRRPPGCRRSSSRLQAVLAGANAAEDDTDLRTGLGRGDLRADRRRSWAAA